MCDNFGSQVLIFFFFFGALHTDPLLLPFPFYPALCIGPLPLAGGRGSYNDLGGPVITTQVTIPKDVSK